MNRKVLSALDIQAPQIIRVLYAAAIVPAVILLAIWILGFVVQFKNYPLVLYYAGSPLGVVPTFAVAFFSNVIYGLPLVFIARHFKNIKIIYWLPVFVVVGYFGGLLLYWAFTYPHEFLSGYPYGLLGVSSSSAVWYLGVYVKNGKNL